MYETFKEALEQWPSMSEYGEDIGVPADNARKMKERDSIPSRYWTLTEVGARSRGIKGVTIATLARIAAAKKTSKARGKK